MCLGGCGGGSGGSHQAAASAQSRETAKPFTVTSTLDAKHVLPHRIRWLASPSLPAAQVKEVEFLIDGKVTWIEKQAPYAFSEESGYLVTSWLDPGQHSFGVRAVSVDGRTASDTVKARVAKVSPLPGGLAGTWHRRVNGRGAPRAGTPGNPTETFTPSGTYTMVIDSRWIQMRFPGHFEAKASESTGAGWILNSDYTAVPGRLQALGEVSTRPFDGGAAEGGPWCYPGGPSSSYSWSVSDGVLTLKPSGGHDACDVRGFILTGKWRR